VAIGILLLFNTYQRESYDTGGDDRVIIGKALQPFAQKGYRMVCSEAGCLSFYSDWITFDPFGLTDEYITHHGLTFEYLEKIKPDLIMFHSSKNLIRISKNELWEKNHQRTSWGLMLRRLYNYAEEKKYVLAAAIRKGGRDNDIHWYYVRPDCPDKTIIIKVITNQNNLSYYKKNRAA
jgi:hypothetical protein